MMIFSNGQVDGNRDRNGNDAAEKVAVDGRLGQAAQDVVISSWATAYAERRPLVSAISLIPLGLKKREVQLAGELRAAQNIVDDLDQIVVFAIKQIARDFRLEFQFRQPTCSARVGRALANTDGLFGPK
jgi:hypothetical protein